ncbi:MULTISPECIES: sulfurtransferase TusA family protein [unclassified Rhizobium]|uniref:sulfurtransferase TusA family protein n=1 Tax=unclassified Rhizobium TaxID=2613769 RepID=UPI001600A512|nr:MULTISPECIES: sulfurtransferase TusA family protein [unclassified Rhizobium]MBB1249052.1 sulfurtransferase TusA family protein [Rhizobium sp. G21]MCV3767004.1 sulfurtransferase TusA family protein [Rhizobium sp. TRM95796]
MLPGEPDLVLDLKGLKCPLPVLKSRKAMASLSSGALLRVLTTDPLAGLDIPHFCREDGHTLIAQERGEQGHVFLIRRG